MAEDVGRPSKVAAASSTPDINIWMRNMGGRICVLRSLILEANGSWRLAACYAELDLALVKPSLVSWLVCDITGTAHTVVETKLLHEAVIRLAYCTGCAKAF